MTVLGDTLELLHLASGRLTTVEAVGQEWHNTELSRQAMERIQNHSIAMLTSRGKNARIISPEYRRSYHCFYKSPSSWRVEYEASADMNQSKMLQVSNGERLWTYFPDDARAHVQPLQQPAPFYQFLDSAWLSAATVIDSAEVVSNINVNTIVLRGHPRPNVRFPRPCLTPGSTEFEAIVDSASAIVVSLTSFLDGEAIGITRLTDLVVAEPIDDATFTFEPPTGVTVDDLSSQRPPLQFRLLSTLIGGRTRKRNIKYAKDYPH